MAEEKQITKKQHFVPKFYLRKFTNTNNEVEILDCDKRKIIKPSGVSGMYYEKFYYGVKTGEVDEVSQLVEEGFNKIETELSGYIGKIIEDILEHRHISDDKKWFISMLMSMLWIRGPMMRKQMDWI